MVSIIGKQVVLLSATITLLLCVTSGAGGAAESRPTWQIEWEKTLKAAEAEGEVTVYVVDYPRSTVSQFQKAYPKIKLNLVDGPSRPRACLSTHGRAQSGKISSRSLYYRTRGPCFSFVSCKGSGSDASGVYLA